VRSTNIFVGTRILKGLGVEHRHNQKTEEAITLLNSINRIGAPHL